MKKVNFKEIDFKKVAMLHCEKAVLGCFVVCLLYFVYQTTQTSIYGVTPEQISADTKKVQDKVALSKWEQYETDLSNTPEKPRPELPPTPYPKVVDDFILQPPNLALYGQSTWFAPVVRPDIKRREIQPRYAVEELAATYGYGPFAIRDPNFRPDQPQFEEPQPEPTKKKSAAPNPKGGMPPGGEPAGYPGPAPRTAAGKGARRALDQLKAGVRRPAGPPGPGVPGYAGPQGLPPGSPRNNMLPPGMGNPYGRGGFGSVTVGQGVKVEGRRWIVITGAVPFDKQEKALWEAINATQQNYVRGRDDLAYVGFHIKRAEVTAGTEEKEVNWDKVAELNFDKLQREMGVWEENPLELVDNTVIVPALNVPLPPLVGRAWEPEEVIHKRIPILKEEDLIKQAQEEIEAEREAANKKDDEDLPAGAFRNPNARTQRPGEMPEYRPGAARTAYRQGPGATAARETPYRQFRFFDFDVQPGKSYQYKVQLVFRNPNYQLSEKEVEDVKFAKDKFLTSQWSAPSRVVTCPLDSNLLVGPVTSRTPSKEPEATIMVRQWDHPTGVNAAKKFTQLARGQISNFVGQEVKVTDPRNEAVMDAKMDFTTNMLLADFVGGQKLHARGPKTEPGDLLFVNLDGSLVVKSELEDMRDFKAEQQRNQQLSEEAQPAQEDISRTLFPGEDILAPKQRPPKGGS